MQSRQSAVWSSLQGDCCTASGVTCVGQIVFMIRWTNMRLNGTINETAIPSSVSYLNLNDNELKGSIPNGLPSALTELYLWGNQMSNDLPSFPSELKWLGLGYPGFSGNYFTGTLRLNKPIAVEINDNWITDIVIRDSSQINSIYCDLSNNPLFGNPNLANLTMCTQIGLYSANLLPNTKSILTSGPSSDFGTTATTMRNATITLIADKVRTSSVSKSFVPLNHSWVLLEMIKILLKLLVEMIILLWVIYKTPWKREIKNKIKKRTKRNVNLLLIAS